MGFHKNEKLEQYLKYIAAAGVIATVAACPILPIALYPFLKKGEDLSEKRERRRIIKSLLKSEYISVEKAGDVKITEKGNIFMNLNKLDQIKVNKASFWDKKWRIVLFDIPVEKGFIRDVFRKFLKRVGFQQFQKSVFICPNPCESEVREAAEMLGIWQNVNLIRADKIDREDEILKLFNMKDIN